MFQEEQLIKLINVEYRKQRYEKLGKEAKMDEWSQYLGRMYLVAIQYMYSDNSAGFDCNLAANQTVSDGV